MVSWLGSSDQIQSEGSFDRIRVLAECDVVDVDEDLVAALLVPHLVPGVAGVLQDGPWGTQ